MSKKLFSGVFVEKPALVAKAVSIALATGQIEGFLEYHGLVPFIGQAHVSKVGLSVPLHGRDVKGLLWDYPPIGCIDVDKYGHVEAHAWRATPFKGWEFAFGDGGEELAAIVSELVAHYWGK